MIKIGPNNISHSMRDRCHNRAIAILWIDDNAMPLCANCVKQLAQTLEDYIITYDTITCDKCKYFTRIDYGYEYGSCQKKAEKDGKSIPEKLDGYVYTVNCTDTCIHAALKEE